MRQPSGGIKAEKEIQNKHKEGDCLTGGDLLFLISTCLKKGNVLEYPSVTYKCLL